MRIGTGTNVCRLETGVPTWVAGLHSPDGPFGLFGHFDDDVAAHVIVDALLVSAGLGDIGSSFGTGYPEWKGASGIASLTETARLLRTVGFRICNVSAQVIGNRPRMAAHRDEVGWVFSEAVGAPVSVFATTTDGLGLTGRGEGAATIAVAMTIVG